MNLSLNIKSISIGFLITNLFFSSLLNAYSLPEGAFKGDSNLINNGQNKDLLNTISNETIEVSEAYTQFAQYDRATKGLNRVNGWDNDVMALLVKKDMTAADSYYVILAEYDRVPFTNFGKRFPLTRWVNRMYAYHMTKVSELTYSLSKLAVKSAGTLQIDKSVSSHLLQLKKADSFDGAKLIRKNSKSESVEEVIVFNGRVGSTWEGFVPGQYFGSVDNTGGDYFDDTVNTTVATDYSVAIKRNDINGMFEMKEQAPGLFSLSANSKDVKGADKIEDRIVVFIDIVNWKHLGIKKFTTEEMLIINPDDASDVGFYYERHSK